MILLIIYFFGIILVNINCNGNEVNTTPKVQVSNSVNIDIVQGTEVDIWFNAEDVVYCKLINPLGYVFYDNFGRCRLVLDKVTMDHHGNWEMYVGYPGKATWHRKSLVVNVLHPEPKAKVLTTVEEARPNITVTCSLPSNYQVQGCRLRGPQGVMLLASGTIENIANINGTRYETRLEGSKCRFRIIYPDVKTLGFWRCSMSTESDSFFGFAKVVSSWQLNVTSVANTINQGPLLRVDHASFDVIEGEPVIMSCSIDAPIRYCYFRNTEDGTIFNVSPGLKSPSMEYVGSGFDAGECGLKLNDYKYPNRTWSSRLWSCNVALATGSQQKRKFWVAIRERMELYQEPVGAGGIFMLIRGRIRSTELEYCRFVRDDVYGFAHDENLTDPRIRFAGSLPDGICELTVREPTLLDYAPWTIVAKVIGEDVEVSATTTGTRYPWNWYTLEYRRRWRIAGWVLLGVVVVAILVCCFGVFLGMLKKSPTTPPSTDRQTHNQTPPPPYTAAS